MNSRCSKEIVSPVSNLFRISSSDSERANLVGSRCKVCGLTFFPRKQICPKCFREGTMKEKLLSRIGKLYSFTIIHIAPSGFKAPYAVGYVDLPERVRVFAPITGWQSSEKGLEIGMAVELVIGTIKQIGDKSISGPIFRVIKGG